VKTCPAAARGQRLTLGMVREIRPLNLRGNHESFLPWWLAEGSRRFRINM
jgi:hypothetical protein